MYHSRITGGDKQSILGTKNLVWGFGMFYGGFAQFCVGMKFFSYTFSMQNKDHKDSPRADPEGTLVYWH